MSHGFPDAQLRLLHRQATEGYAKTGRGLVFVFDFESVYLGIDDWLQRYAQLRMVGGNPGADELSTSVAQAGATYTPETQFLLVQALSVAESSGRALQLSVVDVIYADTAHSEEGA